MPDIKVNCEQLHQNVSTGYNSTCSLLPHIHVNLTADILIEILDIITADT